MKNRVLLTVAALAAIAASSCDESPSGPVPAITLALSSSTLSITQGASGSVSVMLDRQNGFVDTVAVTVEGLPTGVTAQALRLPPGQAIGTLTFLAANTAVVGPVTLTVRAAAPGVAAVTAPLSMAVEARGITGTWRISYTSMTTQTGSTYSCAPLVFDVSLTQTGATFSGSQVGGTRIYCVVPNPPSRPPGGSEIVNLPVSDETVDGRVSNDSITFRLGTIAAHTGTVTDTSMVGTSQWVLTSVFNEILTLNARFTAARL